MKDCIALRKYVSGSLYNIKDILKKRISCQHPKEYNDPLDSYFYYSSSEKYLEFKKILKQEIMDSIRTSCFMASDKSNTHNMLMWTHYANSHRGFALEYVIPDKEFDMLLGRKYEGSKVYLDKVSYHNDLLKEYKDIFSNYQLQNYSENNYEDLLKTCFYFKDDTYKYENEIRLLKYCNSTDNIDYFNFDYLTKIIFGMRCSNDLQDLVVTIVKIIYGDSVKLYKVDNDFKEIEYGK